MKKNILLLISAFFSFSAFAQTTVNIYATGAAGSYTTGNSDGTVRNDNNIVTTASAGGTRGYAVFDLASIPASAVITGAELHFNIAVVTPGGGFGWNTRGFDGDLSTVTVPGTLFTQMGLAPIIWTTPYSPVATSVTFASNATSEAFVTTNLGGKATVTWTTNSNRVYTITGESGTATPTGTHAPYLTITYNCPGITSITATPPAVNPCPDAAFSLSGSATGTISGYLWTGPLGFSSPLPNPVVSSGLPSSGMYTLTVTDPSGCAASATTMVTVNPNPVADITPATLAGFCAGENAMLSATIPTYPSYQWYDGTTAIPGATDNTYTTSVTGTYKVEVVDANGCTAITSVGFPTILLDNLDVTPADSVLLCNGDNGNISVNTNGVTAGLAFQWQKDGVDIPGAVNVNYIVSTTGLYQCVVSVPTSPSGCTTTSNDVFTLVNNYPIPTVNYTGTILSTSSSFAVYQWFVNTVAIPGATNFTYSPTTSGNYRVRVTDGNGCSAFSTGYPVNTVSVKNVSVESISLYPNPVNNTLSVSTATPVNVVVSTIEGKVIISKRNTTTVDFETLPAGLYLVTVYSTDGERLLVEKITKQ